MACKLHTLKILPEYFEAVNAGMKQFEIRYNDRDYHAGDILELNEYTKSGYTGRVIKCRVTYLTDYAQQDNYVVMGIKPITADV